MDFFFAFHMEKLQMQEIEKKIPKTLTLQQFSNFLLFEFKNLL